MALAMRDTQCRIKRYGDRMPVLFGGKKYEVEFPCSAGLTEGEILHLKYDAHMDRLVNPNANYALGLVFSMLLLGFVLICGVFLCISKK